MSEQIYTNYRLQLPNEEVLGTLVVRDGAIADIQPGVVSTGHNGGGDYLMPGLIELHTDNVERCIAPRPGIEWPIAAAAVSHDREVISAGITTVYDAISIGDFKSRSLRLTHCEAMMDAILHGQLAGRFAADHRIHLRCEISYEHAFPSAEVHLRNPLVSLMSLMDHTPGQRQFVRMDKFKQYYMGKHGVSPDEIEDFIQQRYQDQEKYSLQNRKSLVNLAKQNNIALASHDDATTAHVQEAIEDGAAIAEFPTTLEAAREAHQHNLHVLMGAPNIVLGKSHSGNVSAMELVKRDQLDILSSDYAPQSLLQAIFVITKKTGKPLHEAMQVVTSNPAKAVNLFGDRGSLEVGKRADLIAVRDDGTVPRLTAVMRQGLRVA
ncbi:MAG: phosphonate metabolism protein PhnM [Leptolyngbyaceae bacterium]|nr:phosphonate metabolism protein PhnM [Leptolyngbyaceae bacterium]